jgi:hypothetical protein
VTAEHIRDAAMTAVIFGFFATTWFGWAQEAPPRAWRRPLIAGTIAAVLTAVTGAVVASRHWGHGTAFDEGTSRTFGIVVGIEFGLAALGAAVLAVRRRSPLIPVWIALVVGLHLFPVAWLIRYPAIHVVAALVTAGALLTVPAARWLSPTGPSGSVALSAVVGAFTGAVLLAGAVYSVAVAGFAY